MSKFIAELRRRGVFQVAGLYIAIMWLILQIADVVFPAFELSDYIIRYILYAGMAGLPVALLSAWFFELTDQGLLRDEDWEKSGARRIAGSRGMYIITLLALVVALGISVFFNVQSINQQPVAVPESLSILVADFDNATGDPIFESTLEQSLIIGLESASFITAYDRERALKAAGLVVEGEGLGEQRARLVAVREGIDLVLLGSIRPAGTGFLMQVLLKNARDGETLATVQVEAENKLEVLGAIGELALDIREVLGDVSLDSSSLEEEESFSTASLKAVSYYGQAQALSHRGQDEEAVALYEKAVAEDPGFGRAYSGWALSEFNLGHQKRSSELWDKALSLLGNMTERERYRTLGVYYSIVSRNRDKAIENYELLVSHYPADTVGRNNLAVTYLFDLRFSEALEQGRKALDIYPENPTLRSNYALYAMYAGDFDLARSEAESLLKQDPEFFKAYLPIAMAALASGDILAAKAAYKKMAELGDRGASLASIGLADIALFQEEAADALANLELGIAQDEVIHNRRGLADKYIALAQAKQMLGEEDATRDALAQALELSNQIAHKLPAALIYIELGNLEEAQSLVEGLADKLQIESRAASGLVQGMLYLARGDNIAAIDTLRHSQKMVDSWLIRRALGQAYYEAGFHAEALSEFELCQSRIGEATSVFLDDIPSFRYALSIENWLVKTRQALSSPRPKSGK